MRVYICVYVYQHMRTNTYVFKLIPYWRRLFVNYGVGCVVGGTVVVVLVVVIGVVLVVVMAMVFVVVIVVLMMPGDSQGPVIG